MDYETAISTFRSLVLPAESEEGCMKMLSVAESMVDIIDYFSTFLTWRPEPLAPDTQEAIRTFQDMLKYTSYMLIGSANVNRDKQLKEKEKLQ